MNIEEIPITYSLNNDFDLNDTEQQMLAFNWRNTSALSPKENLAKNNKIIG